MSSKTKVHCSPHCGPHGSHPFTKPCHSYSNENTTTFNTFDTLNLDDSWAEDALDTLDGSEFHMDTPFTTTLAQMSPDIMYWSTKPALGSAYMSTIPSHIPVSTQHQLPTLPNDLSPPNSSPVDRTFPLSMGMGYNNVLTSKQTYLVQPGQIFNDPVSSPLQTPTPALVTSVAVPPPPPPPPPPPVVKERPKPKRELKQEISKQISPTASPKRPRGRPRNPPPYHGLLNIQTVRQVHLEKNKFAAHKCRQRKKEYIQDLEKQAREAVAKNHDIKITVAELKEEILVLKAEVLKHGTCGFWGIDQYLIQQTGDLMGTLFDKWKDGGVKVADDTQGWNEALQRLSEANVLMVAENNPTADDDKNFLEKNMGYDFDNMNDAEVIEGAGDDYG